jgi:hypothetical protein
MGECRNANASRRFAGAARTSSAAPAVRRKRLAPPRRHGHSAAIDNTPRPAPPERNPTMIAFRNTSVAAFALALVTTAGIFSGIADLWTPERSGAVLVQAADTTERRG